MNHEQTIKLICEKLGIKTASFIEGDICMRNLNPALADNALIGFLKSKDVLVAVFGEERVRIGRNAEDVELETISSLPAWKYHAQQMGYELEEILSYYEKYLRKGKE